MIVDTEKEMDGFENGIIVGKQLLDLRAKGDGKMLSRNMVKKNLYMLLWPPLS